MTIPTNQNTIRFMALCNWYGNRHFFSCHLIHIVLNVLYCFWQPHLPPQIWGCGRRCILVLSLPGRKLRYARGMGSCGAPRSSTGMSRKTPKVERCLLRCCWWYSYRWWLTVHAKALFCQAVIVNKYLGHTVYGYSRCSTDRHTINKLAVDKQLLSKVVVRFRIRVRVRATFRVRIMVKVSVRARARFEVR